MTVSLRGRAARGTRQGCHPLCPGSFCRLQDKYCKPLRPPHNSRKSTLSCGGAGSAGTRVADVVTVPYAAGRPRACCGRRETRVRAGAKRLLSVSIHEQAGRLTFVGIAASGRDCQPALWPGTVWPLYHPEPGRPGAIGYRSAWPSAKYAPPGFPAPNARDNRSLLPGRRFCPFTLGPVTHPLRELAGSGDELGRGLLDLSAETLKRAGHGDHPGHLAVVTENWRGYRARAGVA